MAKKATTGKPTAEPGAAAQKAEIARALSVPVAKPSALLDTRVIYCGDCLEQLRKLPDACVDLIGMVSRHLGIDPPFNSNRNYEVFWGETPCVCTRRSLRP